MKELVSVLQVGIVLTTPVFFLAVLLILWRLVRTTEATVALLFYVKQYLNALQRPLAGDDIHTTAGLREAERHQVSAQEEGPPDAGHCG